MRGRILIGLAWLGAALLLYTKASFSAGGSDSSGYLNAARLFAEGRVVDEVEPLLRFHLPVEEAPTFTPLGFAPAARKGWIAPSYPPGLPAHMALAGLAFGWKRGPFLVAPAAALVGLWLMYRVGRKLELPGPFAVAGSLMLGLFPTFTAYALQAMSDVPATAWALAAVLAGLEARERPTLAFVAGLAVAVAVWVRPTNLLLVLPLVFALPKRAGAFARLALGGLPLALALFAYDAAAFGSPFRTGNESLLEEMAWGNVLPNARYLLGWVALLGGAVPLAGFAAVAADRRVSTRDRALLFSWFGAFLGFYVFYQPFQDWFFTRFLLPGMPALILGFLLVLRDRVAPGPEIAPAVSRRRSRAAAGLVGVVLAVNVGWILWSGVLNNYRVERVYPLASRAAEAAMPREAVVACMQMSGALRYYTSLTPVRWDWIEAARFPSLRAQVEARGGRWYALVAPFELKGLETNLPGRWTPIGTVRDYALLRLEPPDRPSNTPGAGVP